VEVDEARLLVTGPDLRDALLVDDAQGFRPFPVHAQTIHEHAKVGQSMVDFGPSAKLPIQALRHHGEWLCSQGRGCLSHTGLFLPWHVETLLHVLDQRKEDQSVHL
jgi:hypothetical protein